MSRIANIIRGLFGRKPVHQQKDSMAPRGNGEKSVQPMPENVIQKIPVEAKMMKEVSYMELQTVKQQPYRHRAQMETWRRQMYRKEMGMGQKYR